MMQWLTESFHSLLACNRSFSESMKKLQDAKDMGWRDKTKQKIESLLRETPGGCRACSKKQCWWWNHRKEVSGHSKFKTKQGNNEIL